MAIAFDEETKAYSDGDTTLELKNGAYEIDTLDQLKLFRDAVNEGYNFKDETVKLTASIDLSTEALKSGRRSGRAVRSFREHSTATGRPSAI